MTEDRPLYRDIAAVAEIIATGELLDAVVQGVGKLA